MILFASPFPVHFAQVLQNPRIVYPLETTHFSKKLWNLTSVFAFYPRFIARVAQNLRTTAGTQRHALQLFIDLSHAKAAIVRPAMVCPTGFSGQEMRQTGLLRSSSQEFSENLA
jgi:hypothetical protein